MNELPPMTQLDYMVSTNETLMLKAFLPYISADFAPFLAIYIKYSELMSTINLFKDNKNVFKKYESQDFFHFPGLHLHRFALYPHHLMSSTCYSVHAPHAPYL